MAKCALFDATSLSLVRARPEYPRQGKRREDGYRTWTASLLANWFINKIRYRARRSLLNTRVTVGESPSSQKCPTLISRNASRLQMTS